MRRCDPNDKQLKLIMEYQSLLSNPETPLSEYNDDDKTKVLAKIAGDLRAAFKH